MKARLREFLFKEKARKADALTIGILRLLFKETPTTTISQNALLNFRWPVTVCQGPRRNRMQEQVASDNATNLQKVKEIVPPLVVQHDNNTNTLPTKHKGSSQSSKNQKEGKARSER